MGNSDSKASKLSPTPGGFPTQSIRIKIHSLLEAEFLKRSTATDGYITRGSFQECLKSVQEDFGLYSIASSPLGIGLFEISATERPGGQSLISMAEYASAMAVIFNNIDQATLSSLTTQAILKWYVYTHPSSQAVHSATDEIVSAFFEASWKFAWDELFKRLSSNIYLSGKAESECLTRFSDIHSKYFVNNPATLKMISTQPLDRTISISVGDEQLHVPTSFSFLCKNRAALTSSPQNRTRGAYPEI